MPKKKKALDICEDPVAPGMELYQKIVKLVDEVSQDWESCGEHYVVALDTAFINFFIFHYSVIGQLVDPQDIREIFKEHSKLILETLDERFPLKVPDGTITH